MPNKSSYKPAGASTVSPFLCVQGGAKALEFYKSVFGAKEIFRMDREGKVGHAQIAIGENNLMLADEWPNMEFRSPKSVGGTPVYLHLYVTDVDATVANALNRGARLAREVEDMFYGDRSGLIEDPFGHFWNVATHVEDVPPAELERRAKAQVAR